MRKGIGRGRKEGRRENVYDPNICISMNILLTVPGGWQYLKHITHQTLHSPFGLPLFPIDTLIILVTPPLSNHS